ncbi:MFS transporter [Thalassobaculum fulvum]|uniref:MFS transporter n=1 Tax=Thalassobaculum fulvum TaxID=1633335 RepID=A0A918XQ56_9PROT|nr:MFS transporter [Thalassobaculum fulvum]GHD46151.1 MFS transporter [Thalassobaculum fulvum]
MQLGRPVFFKRLGAPGAEAFAVLFALESFARALLATVIPIEALRFLGTAGNVSSAFFAASLCALCASLGIPWLVRKTARRWVYSLGFVGLASAPALFTVPGFESFMAGMVVRAIGTVAVTVCLSLYILDFIAKKDLSRSEPMRLFYSAAAWAAGPFLGVWLAVNVGRDAPFLLSAAVALAALGYFWFLRITENPAVVQKAVPVPTPLAYVRRYFAQPRLRLAWVMTTGRNVWWVVFFIYVPVYAVKTGLGPEVGGAVVSVGASFLFLTPLTGRLVRREGIRRVFVAGYLLASVATFLVAASMGQPWIGIVLIVCAALGMSAIDAGGNMLFLFAVRRHERSEMTTVYSTYRDVADIVPPGLFSVLLRVFELPAVFVVGGAVTLGLALLARRIHPRLGREARPPAPLAVGEPAQ